MIQPGGSSSPNSRSLLALAGILVLGFSGCTYHEHHHHCFPEKEQPQANPSPSVEQTTPAPAPADPIVYVTETGQRYHSAGCQYLRRSTIPKRLSEAHGAGYGACSRCW